MKNNLLEKKYGKYTISELSDNLKDCSLSLIEISKDILVGELSESDQIFLAGITVLSLTGFMMAKRTFDAAIDPVVDRIQSKTEESSTAKQFPVPVTDNRS